MPSAWSTPKQVKPPTEAELVMARSMVDDILVSLRIGYKTGVLDHIVGGINARLAEGQIMKVEFVKINGAPLDKLVGEIEVATKSICVGRHAGTATFFRRHPNLRFP